MIEKKVAAGNDPRLSSDKAKSARLVSFHFRFDRAINIFSTACDCTTGDCTAAVLHAIVLYVTHADRR